jgi:hypothetical protein
MPRHKRPSPRFGDPSPTTIGVAWYQREEWPRLLAAASDRDDLEDTYDEWLQTAERTLLDLTAQCLAMEEVEVGVDELVSWCQKQGQPLNGAARADYVSHKLMLRHAKSQQKVDRRAKKTVGQAASLPGFRSHTPRRSVHAQQCGVTEEKKGVRFTLPCLR